MANVWRTLGRGANAVNRRLYRASGGRLMGKLRGMPVLLITVAGRKTGTMHTNPVMYLEDDGRYVVTGSGGGSAAEPQWFKNLRSTHEAEIEIGRRKLAVSVVGRRRRTARHPLEAAGRARTLLRRLSEEGRAADTNGDLDAQDLTSVALPIVPLRV